MLPFQSFKEGGIIFRSDKNFHIKGDGNYDSLYLQDIDDDDRDENPGVVRDPGLNPTDNPVNVPTNEEYGDMIIDERPAASPR